VSDPATYWNGSAGDTWVAMADQLDRELETLGHAVFERARVAPGDRVLDIGCGTGRTSAQLAERVGPTGTVTSVDISAPMLALARARHPHLTFVEADAQTHPFAEASADVAVSRFGVMFFPDPIAAFANIARALVPGGRLAFVCWRPAEENPIMTVPLSAALAAGISPPAPKDPNAPGPFAFADSERVAKILHEAGFVEISHEANDERIGNSSFEDTLELSLRVGPLGAMIREQPELRDQAIDAVRAALETYRVGDVVLMPSATWFVTARTPPR